MVEVKRRCSSGGIDFDSKEDLPNHGVGRVVKGRRSEEVTVREKVCLPVSRNKVLCLEM